MDGVSLIARAGIYVGKMYGRGKEEGKKKKREKREKREKNLEIYARRSREDR